MFAFGRLFWGYAAPVFSRYRHSECHYGTLPAAFEDESIVSLGMKARKEVQAIYGFKVKPSLMHRKTIALSPTEMKARRASVAKIQKGLPAFVYD